MDTAGAVAAVAMLYCVDEVYCHVVLWAVMPPVLLLPYSPFRTQSLRVLILAVHDGLDHRVKRRDLGIAPPR